MKDTLRLVTTPRKADGSIAWLTLLSLLVTMLTFGSPDRAEAADDPGSLGWSAPSLDFDPSDTTYCAEVGYSETYSQVDLANQIDAKVTLIAIDNIYALGCHGGGNQSKLSRFDTAGVSYIGGTVTINAGSSSGYARYRFEFFETGTSTPATLEEVLIWVSDMDGGGIRKVFGSELLPETQRNKLHLRLGVWNCNLCGYDRSQSGRSCRYRGGRLLLH
jgi:hypothetical protein